MIYTENLCDKGFDHNPLWRPLYWRLFWEYMPYDDFLKEYPSIVLTDGDVKTKHYLYRLRGKTRKIVHRIHLKHLHLSDRPLYEKTPSERVVPKYKEL